MTGEKTKLLVTKMNADSPYFWQHEWRDCISTTVCVEGTNYNIWFGHANETFGASVTGDEGEDLGYIETNLIFEDTDVDVLAENCIKLVRAYIAGR